ncbi:MAG: VWA domain-containing protein [Anaerolineales bacterium]|nr:VWA domain-containing protein [Anaerolineales bacterium]
MRILPNRLILILIILILYSSPLLLAKINVDETSANLTKLLPSDIDNGDWFGIVIDVDGDTAVIGAPYALGNGTNSGAAFIYERADAFSPWQFSAKLIAPDGNDQDRFGEWLAIDGNTIAVGAHRNDEAAMDAGAVYLFYRDTQSPDQWNFIKKIMASDAKPASHFGYVDLNGDTLIVGAALHNAVGTESGAAYVFERNHGGSDNWGELKQLIPSDAAANDNFGRWVTIDKDRIVVSGHDNNDFGTDSGSVYIFERNVGGTDNWGEVKKLTASDASAYDVFGHDVNLWEDTLVVGARFGDGVVADSGTAYIFEKDAGGLNNWGEVAKLASPDGKAGDNFGWTTAVYKDTVLIGASRHEGNGIDDVGAAFLYQRDNSGNWQLETKLISINPVVDEGFGDAIALGQNSIFIGARNNNEMGTEAGIVYAQNTITQIFLPLILKPNPDACSPVPQPVDVALVLDTSGSMEDPITTGGEPKIDTAKNAIVQFINLMDFTKDQGAFITFDTTADLRHELSSNKAGLITAVNAATPGGSTRIDRAFETAAAELTGPRHQPDALSAIILLTDGNQNGGELSDVYTQANLAKAQGIEIYTIGFGPDANQSLLQDVASAPNYYYFAPTDNELADIYEQIAEELQCNP